MKSQDREYIITDQCAYMGKPPKNYSPDPKRKPHAIMLVDPDTGSIYHIQSGSRIKIVSEKLYPYESKTNKKV